MAYRKPPPPGTPRVALVHGLPISIEPVRQAFEAEWPQAWTWNLLDDGLVAATEELGFGPQVQARFEALCRYCHAAGAGGILFTGSAFGPAIEAARRCVPIPVLKPYEAMIDAALRAGSRLAIAATYPATLDLLEGDLLQEARQRNLTPQVRRVYVEGALEALGRKDEPAHDELVFATCAAIRDADAILLAQFSMSRVAARLAERTGVPVYTAPEAAVRELRRRMTA